MTNDCDTGINSVPVACCYVCGNEGKPLYEKLKDRLFNIEGDWDLMRCESSGCGLVWLTPRPINDDIGKLYEEYVTHEIDLGKPTLYAKVETMLQSEELELACGYESDNTNILVKMYARFRSLFGYRLETVESSVMWLNASERGRLLDVGCGNGLFLKKMRGLGWQVAGVEPDPKAVQVARNQHGLQVSQGTLMAAELQENSFDVVTMSHVIEHVSDPIDLLRACHRVLKPGGKLVAVTPNNQSLGQKWFGDSCLALDPPRHLYLFSPRSIERCAQQAGFTSNSVRSVARLAPFIWTTSKHIRRNGKLPCLIMPKSNKFMKYQAKMFLIYEYYLCKFKNVGEELLLVAIK
jgi:SAM-dependent methyltransferase